MSKKLVWPAVGIAAYVLTAALAVAFSGCAAVGTGPQKPTENIVFITLDTVGAGHLSCYGYNRQTTPNLDKIAAEGVQFTNAYTPMPYTLPSLTTMFTSKYPWVHGIVNNYPSRSGLKFPVLTEQLRNRGYVTGAFVPTDFFSEDNTHFEGFSTYNIGSPSYNHGKYYAYSDAEAQTKKAMAWLEKHKKSNMFLWVHYLDPHFPYDAPEPYSGKFSSQFNDIASPRIKNLNYGTDGIPMRERTRGVQARNSTDDIKWLQAKHDEEIAVLDSQIGVLMQKIKDLNLEGNTTVIIVADHGESFDHGYLLHGWRLYQSSVRVPLIIKSPAVKQPGRKYEGLVETIDLFPTITDIAHLKTTLAAPEGHSLYNVLTQPGFTFEKKVYAQSIQRPADRSRPPTYVGQLRSVRSGDYKLIYHLDDGLKELYNLKDDPAETNNLYDTKRDIGDTLFLGLSEKFKQDQLHADTPDLQENLEALKSLGYN